MLTVPYVLSPDDSAKAVEFARHIMQQANPADKMKIARYGMDLFQQFPVSLAVNLEYLATLYLLSIPGLQEFLEPLIDHASDDRLTAFENAIALNVHQLCTGRALAVQSFEVSHE